MYSYMTKPIWKFDMQRVFTYGCQYLVDAKKWNLSGTEYCIVESMWTKNLSLGLFCSLMIICLLMQGMERRVLCMLG
jgi:hypothetical protein